MSEQAIRTLLVEKLAVRLKRLGLERNDLTDDLDLVRTGVLDSLGFVDLIADLEQATGRQVDLERALKKAGATRLGSIVELFNA
ncbi:MAG: acyl carrier protein [Flavobacteriales bacterium]|nr:acyl carrier protein [Flavobacteriales bacterium]